MSDTYYNDLGRCAPMTAAEEHTKAKELAALRRERDRLAELMSDGDGTGDQPRQLAEAEHAFERARNEFVQANLRLVVKLACQYSRDKVPLSDLIQEGNIGLMTAVDRFDHTRGVRFSTYAAWWIRHRVTRVLTNHGRAVRVPNHVAQTSSKLRKAQRTFESMAGRMPTMGELSALTDIPEGKALLTLRTTGRAVSIDGTARPDDRPMHESLSCDGHGSDVVLWLKRRDRSVRDALDALKPIEADIVRKRFAFDIDEPMTLRELGVMHSLSRERVRQIQNAALHKIKRRLTDMAMSA